VGRFSQEEVMSIRKSCFTLFLAAVTVLPAMTARPLHSFPLPLTARQLAAGSPHVVVAVVEDARSVWNAEHTLIFTEYGLRIEEQLKGDAPERVTLRVPGGTVGEETHFTSLSTFLETGARYLLFLEDFGRPTLTPVTGAWQGVYTESAGGFGETLSDARDLIAEVEAHPKASDTAWLSHRGHRAEDPTLPAKTWDSGSAKFFVKDPPVAPIVFNLIQPDNRYFHVDWDMMAYWNVYAADLFRPTDRPSTTWAFGNNVFDVAGFQTEEQLRQRLNASWGTGTHAILARVANGHTIEADLLFNPAYEWTLDDDAATRPGGPLSFKHTMLTSLGLVAGYYGPTAPDGTPPEVPRDSLMSSTLSLATLFAEDTMGVRSAFPGTAIQDGLISSYTLKDSTPTFLPVRASASSVKAGKSFKLLNSVKIENPGTETFTNPSVAVYLVPQRFSMDGAVLLKKFKLKGAVGSGEAKSFALGAVKVPTSVPAGSYYFAFVLEVSGDGYLANNRAWSDPDVKITVTRR
jgi:hypothetical protein